MHDLRLGVRAQRAERLRAAVAAMPPPLPASPEDVPEDAAPSVIDEWIAAAERQGRAAESDGDLDAFAKMGRLVATLLEHRRKAEPPPRADPNEHPDMAAAAQRAREKLHALIDSATGES